MKVENFFRSAKAPVMRAGVMTANIIWKSMKAWWGMVAAYVGFGSAPTPRSPTHSSPPMIPPLSGPKAKL